MPERLRRALPALIGLVLFLAALEVLRTELRTVTWHGLTTDVLSTPPWRLGLALLLTALNYVVLTGYDFLAFAYIGKRLPWRRVMTASFLAYAISNNVGFAMLSGASVRYRFYTRWGITAEELSRIVFSYSSRSGSACCCLVGSVSRSARCQRELGLSVPALVAPVGWLLMLASLAYVAAAGVRLGPIRFRHVELPLPSPRIAVAQLGDLGPRLDARGCGALRPPAARQRAVPGAARSVPRVAVARARQPRARRRGCVRRADGASPQAVPPVGDAAAGAHRLPRGVLPAAALGRAARPGRRRTPSATIAGRSPRRDVRLADRTAHAACAGGVHVPRGRRAAVLRRDAGRGRPAAAARSASCRSA